MSPKVACMNMREVIDKIKPFLPDKKETLVGLIVSLQSLISYNLHYLTKLGLREDFIRECPYPIFLRLADGLNYMLEKKVVKKDDQKDMSTEEFDDIIKDFDMHSKNPPF